MIEKGRIGKLKVPHAERICPICSSAVEDETHFLLECMHVKYIKIEISDYQLMIGFAEVQILPLILVMTSFRRNLWLLGFQLSIFCRA